MQTNGAGEFGEKNSYTLTGTLAPGTVLVYKHSQATIYTDEAIPCSATNFNGNDAVGLFKGETMIDVIGIIDNSDSWGANMTLRRKSSVKQPNIVYTESEWEKLGNDVIDGLGSHTMD